MTEPGRYRRKTPIIEAMLYDGSNAEEVAAWCGGRVDMNGRIKFGSSIHAAQPNEYVVKTNIPEDDARFFAISREMFEHAHEEA